MISDSWYSGVLNRLFSGSSLVRWLLLLPVKIDLGGFIEEVGVGLGDGRRGKSCQPQETLRH